MTARSDAESRAVSRLPSWLLLGGAASWRILAIVVLAYAAVRLLGHVRLLVVAFLISLVMTALLHPLTRWMKRRGFPPAVTALAPILLLVSLVAAVIVSFARGIAQQWGALVDGVVRGWERARSVLAETPMVPEGSTVVRQLREALSSGPFAQQAFQTVYTTAEIVTGAFLVTVFAFFLLRDGPRLTELLLGVLAEHRRDRARAAAHRGWRTLERYIVGVALVSAINTALTGLALIVLQIPMVVPLVLLTFVACFVPFVGTVVATAAGTLVALADRGPKVALFFVLAGIAIEVLESNVTQPLVQGRVLHVHPLLVLAFVTAGTVIFGLPGAFLAVPALAMIYGVVLALRRDEARPPASAAAPADDGAEPSERRDPAGA
jgi:predicted PurR-regulated permease PerM